MTSILEAATYIAIRRYPDGETWIDNTKLCATIFDAIEDIDNLHEVVLIEDGKVIDQSAHAAEIWWQHHGNDCESTFDVPAFIHEHMHNEVYSDISERAYERRCQREHEQGMAR